LKHEKERKKIHKYKRQINQDHSPLNICCYYYLWVW